MYLQFSHGCLENIKNSIKYNVARWKAGKSQNVMNKLNGTGQKADEAMYAYLKIRDGPPAASIYDPTEKNKYTTHVRSMN